MEFILIVIAVALGIALAPSIRNLLAGVGKFILFTVLILLFYFLVMGGQYIPTGELLRELLPFWGK